MLKVRAQVAEKQKENFSSVFAFFLFGIWKENSFSVIHYLVKVWAFFLFFFCFVAASSGGYVSIAGRDRTVCSNCNESFATTNNDGIALAPREKEKIEQYYGCFESFFSDYCFAQFLQSHIFFRIQVVRKKFSVRLAAAVVAARAHSGYGCAIN